MKKKDNWKTWEKLFRICPESYAKMMAILDRTNTTTSWDEVILVAEEALDEYKAKKYNLY